MEGAKKAKNCHKVNELRKAVFGSAEKKVAI